MKVFTISEECSDSACGYNAPFAVAKTKANAVSIIKEKLYESFEFYTNNSDTYYKDVRFGIKYNQTQNGYICGLQGFDYKYTERVLWCTDTYLIKEFMV